jgi:hypothetical protein
LVGRKALVVIMYGGIGCGIIHNDIKLVYHSEQYKWNNVCLETGLGVMLIVHSRQRLA